jgi:exodeoxyribonuclease VII large subunit
MLVPSREELSAVLRNYRHRLTNGLQSRAMTARARVEAAASSPVLRKPFEGVHLRSRVLDELEIRIGRAVRNRHTLAGRQLASIANQLESLSPIGVLGRGYSLTTHATDGQLIRSASNVAVGDEIRTRFGTGAAVSRVERIEPEST